MIRRPMARLKFKRQNQVKFLLFPPNRAANATDIRTYTEASCTSVALALPKPSAKHKPLKQNSL
jgi:hypothetical protein